MKNKTYRFAAAVALLLALCLVFMAPVSADGEIAKVGDTMYADLQEAIKAAAPSGTVEILTDVIIDEWIMFSQRLTISSGQIITLDMDGLTINGNNHTLTVNSIESATNGDRLFHEADNLTIKDLTINYANGVVGGISLKSGEINNVTFNGGVGVLPHNGEITITGCEFNTAGSAIYNEEDRDNLVVTGNKFNTAAGQYAIYLRGNTTFTDNTVISGKVNVVNGFPVVAGNDFGTERFKVYNKATATISGNTINNLVFNDATAVKSTFADNTMSETAQAALDGMTVAKIGATTYGSLTDAIAAAESGDTITLMGDVALDVTGITIPSGKTITLDLNGKIISNNAANTATAAGIINNGILTIKDSVGNGKITSAFTNPDTDFEPEGFPTYATNTISNKGTLIIESGIIESITNGGASYAIDNYQNSVLTVNGGTITGSPNNIAIRIFANGDKTDTSVTINDGTISGKRAIWIQLPGSCYNHVPKVNLNVNGGSLTSTGYTKDGSDYKDVIYSYTYGNSFAGTKVSINGGIFDGDVLFSGGLGNSHSDCTCLDNVDVKALETVTVSGGTFTGEVLSYGVDDTENKKQAMKAFITGGTFSSNPSAYIASGYEVVQPGDKYLVQKYVDRSSSSSSSSSTTEPEEPVDPEQPEEPVVEPETPVDEPEAGEATVETEVTDGGEVELETPTEEPAVDEGGAVVADDDAKITAVVLPTGTDSEVTFIPVSEQPAPAGQEENTKKVFEINVPTYEKGKAAVIKFTMTVAELEADGKTADEVALWHFDEETGEWTKLVTSYTIVDGVVYFEAITNDFSPFAIIYEDEPVDEPVEEPETPASPSPLFAVLAGLGAAVVLRRK